MDVQVKKEHYNFKKYVTIKRWNSYYYQLIEGMDENIKSILFIGIGDEIVPNVIKAKSKIKVDTFDFDEKLKPTIVGDVTKIDKVIKDKYDCIMCCQVLEHIPFENFEDTVKKLSKITNKKVIL